MHGLIRRYIGIGSRKFLARGFGLTGVLFLATFHVGCKRPQSLNPAFHFDLRPHGIITARGQGAVSYDQLAFLDNNILLVAINQRTVTSAVSRADVDLPAAVLLVFDVRQRNLLRTAQRPIEKQDYSLQALNGGRFAIRSESGVQVCSVDLTCRESIPGTTNNGPLLASPSGDTFVVGGYGETEQVLFGSAPLREVNRFRPASQSVLPGNDASTLRFEGNSVYVSETGKPERTLALSATAGSYVSPSRFLSDSEIAISESNNTLLVSRLDGSVLYRIAVAPWYQGTSIFPSSGGKRFGIRETHYTRLNSIVHFTDIDEHRPYDFERIRLFESASGKLMFETQRDPRPYNNALTLPALSPNGRLLATINNGFLEVYEVP